VKSRITHGWGARGINNVSIALIDDLTEYSIIDIPAASLWKKLISNNIVCGVCEKTAAAVCRYGATTDDYGIALIIVKVRKSVQVWY